MEHEYIIHFEITTIYNASLAACWYPAVCTYTHLMPLGGGGSEARATRRAPPSPPLALGRGRGGAAQSS